MGKALSVYPLFVYSLIVRGCHCDPPEAGKQSHLNQQRPKIMLWILHSVPILGTPFRMTAQLMSIVAQRRIPSKAATDVMDSSLRRSFPAIGRDLSHYRAQKRFNSTIIQMPTANWAPFPAIRREGPGMGLNIAIASLIYQ